ncbi:TetR/AcrR family transcriptional regulator [Pseudomonas sp. MF6751]|uniref:TetR/AcrR family transcriptional regulator n=1 Tax=Pseudomonas sp. MF6751 TaxID=2797528 RepID=UPI00190D4781|nr:TetR/AcrR family transcriptional regulator [Pseudomonas sp. MF6751]MBK3478248.1 TetR/AcrR family transcriptional regulator [Pseudomonas sp. MF6751]
MSSNESPAPRRRLSREDRLRQLLDVAWQLVRDEGTDALTLGRLAELAGVTKPVVYDHFATRAGLLAALYADFDERQDQVFANAIATSNATLEERAWVIASSYVDCVLLQGREIPGVIAALSGSPELEASKREYEAIFLDKCRDALSPFTVGGSISQAGLRAMLGAAEALSHAAANGEISREEAQQELLETILGMVMRVRP